MQLTQLKQQLLDIGQQRWAALLVVLIMVIVAFWLLISSVQSLWFSHQNSTVAVPVISNITAPAANIVPSLHLFGSSVTDLKDLPLASLGLQVEGIFMNLQAGNSRALISMTGQAPQMYNVGDMLPGNVKIYKITASSVIVSYNNQLAKLPFSLQGIDFEAMGNHQGLFA